jgi:methionine synthase II (cobalamin-independent)
VFATLLGGLPRAADVGDVEDSIRRAIAAQEAADLEPITDGRLRGELATMDLDPGVVVERWRLAAGLTDRAVKQALPGPYTLGRRVTQAGAAATRDRAAATMQVAASLRTVVEALAIGGCPMIEIEETEAHLIGVDDAERAIFVDAHRVFAEGIGRTHLSLSIVGGSVWETGLETVTAAPYASFAFDLIAGADNWNLVTRLAGDRGVIAGALPAQASPADAKEVLLWAARYAAGSNGRGLDRVGLGSAGSWATLTWEEAVDKMGRLGEAARIARLPGGEALARELDPRAVDARRAAMGHDAPRRGRPT